MKKALNMRQICLSIMVIVCLCSFSTAYAASLAAAWNFEQDPNLPIISDISGVSPALNGTRGSAIIVESGDPIRGKVLDCNAGGVRVGYDSKLYKMNTFTVQYWHKKRNPAENWKYMVGQCGGGPRHFNNNGGMLFDSQTSESGWNPISIPRTDYPNPQVWHQVVATYDGNNFYGYIDGQKVSTVHRGGTVMSQNGNFWSIGQQWDGGATGSFASNNTTDYIDDVAIWTGYAPPEAVLGLYNGTYTIFNAPIENIEPYPAGSYPAADFNKDGFVNGLDYADLAAQWLKDCTVEDCCGVNLADNNSVTEEDLSIFADNWLYKTGTGKYFTTGKILGTTTFKMDSSFVTIPAYSHNWPDPTNVPVNLFSIFGTIIQDFGGTQTHNTWLSTNPDKWDMSAIDRCIYFITKQGGLSNAQLMPWLYCEVPAWWLNDPCNADEREMMVSAAAPTTPSYYYAYYSAPDAVLPRSGPFASLASPKWRQAVSKILENYLDYIYLKGYGDNIAGYKLCGLATYEWYHWSSGRNELSGYGVRTQEAFREWLKVKYNNNVNELRTAWNKPTITFETVVTPTYAERRINTGTRTFRDPGVYMNVIDFERFYNELIVDTIEYFARVVKAKTNNTKVVGAFYHYMYEFIGNPEYGHNAGSKYMNSDTLDFVWVTAAYGYRSLATGGDYQRAPALSAQLHNKIYYNSNDTATYKATTLSDADKLRLGYTDTAYKTLQMFKRSAGFNTTNQMYQDFFDLYDSWYKNITLWNDIGALNGFYDRSKNYDRRSNAQVLVVSDEISCSYTTYKQWGNPLLQYSIYEPQIKLIKMGTQADHIFIDDIPLLPDPNQYKLVIFLNCWNMTNTQRTYVDSLKGNNRVLMFSYAPGYFNGNSTSLSNMQTVTGMTMGVGAETLITPTVYVKSGHLLGNNLIAKGVTSFGPTSGSICKQIYVNDGTATILGGNSSGGTTKYMAIKDNTTWQSIYTITPYMHQKALKEIARYAGVHIYSEADDTFYVNKSYVTLHAETAGDRTIKFPNNVDIYDAIAETLLVSDVNSYTTNFGLAGDTKIFRYVNK
jgi:hypothetical protein